MRLLDDDVPEFVHVLIEGELRLAGHVGGVWRTRALDGSNGDDLIAVSLHDNEQALGQMFCRGLRVCDGLPSDAWSVYAGGGPALNIIDTESATDSEGGFNLLFGTSHSGGLFGEVKVGFLDSPNFKIGVGYTFQWR